MDVDPALTERIESSREWADTRDYTYAKDQVMDGIYARAFGIA